MYRMRTLEAAECGKVFRETLLAKNPRAASRRHSKRHESSSQRSHFGPPSPGAGSNNSIPEQANETGEGAGECVEGNKAGCSKISFYCEDEDDKESDESDQTDTLASKQTNEVNIPSAKSESPESASSLDEIEAQRGSLEKSRISMDDGQTQGSEGDAFKRPSTRIRQHTRQRRNESGASNAQQCGGTTLEGLGHDRINSAKHVLAYHGDSRNLDQEVTTKERIVERRKKKHAVTNLKRMQAGEPAAADIKGALMEGHHRNKSHSESQAESLLQTDANEWPSKLARTTRSVSTNKFT